MFAGLVGRLAHGVLFDRFQIGQHLVLRDGRPLCSGDHAGSNECGNVRFCQVIVTHRSGEGFSRCTRHESLLNGATLPP
jgi:hypothetical protein